MSIAFVVIGLSMAGKRETFRCTKALIENISFSAESQDKASQSIESNKTIELDSAENVVEYLPLLSLALAMLLGRGVFLLDLQHDQYMPIVTIQAMQ